ncbi:patatin-like phospholipase family protein [Flavobacterium sp. RHBU_3]|uniref:patatin-like phospholipase family protein n=1 Tax=Flavobacterium sp. RHBU_3 TaxID=3391184 RepID=UPI003984FE7F
MPENNTFHAGICMAGAVSAGAYTAGVMDYLIEALENWEKAKKLQSEGKLSGIPKHNFKIEVLGGASAGGMTAAISARGLQENFEPITQQNVNTAGTANANPFYNSWVNLKETAKADMMALMLDTSDIDKDINNSFKEVRAGLNSSFIKDIASDLLGKPVTKSYTRTYVAEDLDIFTTLTNLRGFLYEVKFKTASVDRTHRMRMHRDYAFFSLDNNKNGYIPLDFKLNNNATEILKAAAMGTGAFPVGLESRELNREVSYIANNKYLNLMKNKGGAKYELVAETGSFESLNVDGGVINNEPYEITESLLEDRQGTTDLKRSAATFDSVVLMIDPFPNDDEILPPYKIKKAWKNVLPSILSAMRGQLMMKDAEIERAYTDDDFTRFMILPERYNKNNKRQKYTIACGALGGFSGFLSKEFRKHDYFLGRRNCQRFLEKYFNAPESAKNPILESGYEEDTKFGITLTNEGKKLLALIPDMRVEGNETTGYKIVAPQEEGIYPYPKLSLKYIIGLKDKIEKRLECIINNVLNEYKEVETDATIKIATDAERLIAKMNEKSWLGKKTDKLKKPFVNWYLSIGKSNVKDLVADAAIESIVTDLATRGLLKDDVYDTQIGH